MLKINISADDPSPWKIPFLCSIMFDVKDTFSLLMCMFVAHDFVCVLIAVTIKGGNLASFKDLINHS